MSKLAQVISQEEGYGIPNSMPRRLNNPGDLRHSPHASHGSDPDGIGRIDNPADGWADLERQLQLFAERGLSLEQMVYVFAPPGENNSAAYLAYVCKQMDCPATTLVKDALLIT